MKYIFLILLLTLSLGPTAAYTINTVERPLVIPRINWEANEQFTSLESTYWQNILEARRKYTGAPVNTAIRERQRIEQARAVDYINENFSAENTIAETVTHDSIDGFRLAWSQRYTDYVNAIIVHHTTGSYSSDIEALKSIYRFHSLQRGWGDIGYNYIIGLDGNIYEGKKGGDYVVGAHSKWNNNSTVGISVIGDYSEKGVNLKQYEAIKKLVIYLTWRYGIDTSKDYYYHMDCYGLSCDTFPIITRREGRLVGHRDTGNTSCPGDALYSQLMFLKNEIDTLSAGYIPVKRGEIPQGQKEIIDPIVNSYDSYVLKTLQSYEFDELSLIHGRLLNIDSSDLSVQAQDLLVSLKKVINILLDSKKS